MTMRVFIFGAGYSGQAFARALGRDAEWIGGTTRSADRFPGLRAAGIEPFVFDGGALSPDIVAALSRVTHLVASAAPGQTGDPVLAVAADAILARMPELRWIGYLSTVGVYGDHDGAWVDETAACRPVSSRSVQRLDAEQAWTQIAGRREIPLAILRLSGIYGPGRNAFANLAEGTARRIVKPGQVFNRIHVADIAGSLVHLATRETGGIFNVTDDEPAPPQDVVAFAASAMGVAPPPEIPFDEAAMSPMARSFYGENKRVSNAKLKATGYVFAYPDYRTAFARMWAEDDWRGDGAQAGG